LFAQKIKSFKSLVIASHNNGKVTEIRKLLGPLGLKILAADELSLPEPEETENTFSGNAKLKAEAAAITSKLPSLADDSGLIVDALSGLPGIYSARWAGPNKDFYLAMNKVNNALRKLENKNKVSRSASFFCSLALAWPDGSTEVFEGSVKGTVCWPPRGNMGFGYDPFFVPSGHDKTFGEVNQDWKHSISHRSIAFAKFLNYVDDA
jgi:XTP/dITP diphosphohydrolase